MTPESAPRAHPPETLEGWFALHQVFSTEPSQAADTDRLRSAASKILNSSAGGWSALAALIGSRADLLAVQMDLGIITARRGWVEPRHVVNTRPLAELRTVIARKRSA